MSNFRRFNSSGTQYFDSNYVGENGELTWDTTNGLRIHDGSTSGGTQIQGGSNYGNTEVAQYLPTYTSQVGASEIIGTGANVLIESGAYSWSFDNSGNIVGLSDNVTLTAGGNTWTFSPVGVMSLAGGGDIVANTFTALTASGMNAVQAIELKPGGHNPSQYLRVYPTIGEGNHVHITTGDMMMSGLYLGDDVNHVQLGFGNNIVIGTQGGAVFGGNTWQFGGDGSLQLPYRAFGSTILNPVADGLELSLNTYKVWKFGSDGNLVLPANKTIKDTNGNVLLSSGGDGVKYTKVLDAVSNDYTVADEQLVLVYNNASARVITLPASPAIGQTVTIKKVAQFSSAPWEVTVNGNGHNIDASASLVITSGWGYVTVVYASSSSAGTQWWITAASL